MIRCGIEAMLDVLAGAGVRYLFGNPGTTELPLVEALAGDERFTYVLGLQEVPVMAIADGYAQASRSPGVVNLHISCGLGNAMGMLYNAFRGNVPLVVTAGQQDRRLSFEEPILWGDMVAVTRPWTKWAAEVGRVADVPVAVRRAVQTALTPPTGPVFLALPIDVQTGREEVDVSAPVVPDPHIRPSAESLAQAAAVLSRAANPGILVGSRIVEADAVAELIAVAERLGAPVLHEATTSHGRCSFPSGHPLAAPPLPYWSPDVRARLAEFDAILVAGMKLMQQYIYHEPSRPIPEHVALVQIDDDAWELGKNYPLAAPVRGHPKPALAELADRLDAAMTPEQKAAARARLDARGRTHAAVRAALRRQAEGLAERRPTAPLWLMEQLARVLPRNAAVIEESPTTTAGYLERVGALCDPTGYFAHRGWALGWGLNAAIGVKLAWPDRPVLGLIGDGSALYGIQGLWTAARHGIAVTFVVTNNRQYKILKQCAGVLGLSKAASRHDVGLDVVGPEVDYVALARSFGVAAQRIDDAEQLAEAVRVSLAGDKPQLLEIAIDPGEAV